MAKTVGNLLIKLKAEGLDSVTALKSALRTLGQASVTSDKKLEGLRKEIREFAKAGKLSQQSIRGQIDAFKGLKQQATIGSTVYKKLGKDIDSLTQSLDRLNRKEEETGRKRSPGQIAGEFTSAIPEKTLRQLQAQQHMLQKAAVSSEEYTNGLIRINAITQELTRSQQRQVVVANNVVAMNKAAAASAVSSKKIDIERINTTASLRQKIAELTQDLENIDHGSREYTTTTNQLKDAQEQLNIALGISTRAYEELTRAQERSERRAKKIADIQGALGGRRKGTLEIGSRDPSTGAIIAGGTAPLRPVVPTQVREISGLYGSIANIGMAGISADIDRMGKSVNEVTADIKAATAASNGSINSLQNQRAAFTSLRAGISPTSQKFRELTKEIEKVDRRLAKLSTRRGMTLKGVAQTAGGVAAGAVFGGPEGALGALAGAPFGPGGVAAGAAFGATAGIARQNIEGVAEYAAQIDKALIALKGIAGSQENYNTLLEQATKVTKQLNVPQEVAIKGITRLAAAVLGAKGNVNDAALAFTNVIVAIKGTAGGAEDVNSAITALVQIFSKGKVSAEELSGQLGERFPAAVTEFAAANKMTTMEMQAALKQGTVGLGELMNFLVSIGVKYEDIALQIAASNEEAGARSQVAFNEMRLAVGRAIKPIGAELQTAITDFVTNNIETIKAFAKAFVDIVRVILDGIALVIKHGDKLKDLIAIIVGGAIGGKLLTLTATIGGRLIPLAKRVGVLKAAVLLLNRAILVNPFFLLAAGITAAGVAIDRYVRKNDRAVQQIRSGAMDEQQAQRHLLNLQEQRAELQRQLDAKVLPDGTQETPEILQANKSLNAQTGSRAISGADLRPTTNIEPLREKIKKLDDYILVTENAIEARKELQDPTGIEGLLKGLGPLTAFPELKPTGGADGEEAKDISDAMMDARINGMRQIISLADVEAKLANDLLQISFDDLEANQRIVEEAQAHFTAEQSRLQIEQQLKDLQENLNTQLDKALLQTGEITQKEFEQRELSRQRLSLEQQFLPLLLSEKKTREEIDEIIDKIIEGQEEANDKTKTFAEQFANGIKSMGDLTGNLAKITVSAFEGMGNTLAEFVTTGKANFSDLTRSILSDLSKMLIKFAMFQAVKSIFPSLASFLPFSNGGVIGAANGAVIGRNKIVPYAKGGIVKKPTFFQYANGGSGRFGLMGEAGPEAIMPLRRGRNGKLGVESSGSVGNVVVNVDASGSSVQSDQPNAKALGNAIGAAVQAELIKQKRPGGLLS